jgi:hypothetical protein
LTHAVFEVIEFLFESIVFLRAFSKVVGAAVEDSRRILEVSLEAV